MKRSLKKIWAVFLIICMSTGTVLADYTPPSGAIERGTYDIAGTDLQYTLYMVWAENPGENDTYSMHIHKKEGVGENGNFDIPDNPSWMNKELTKELYIDDGVTGIGDNAFSSMILLESVHIPSSVTRIGDGAFSGNARMQADTGTLDLSNVINLGENAFQGCSKITGVALNNTLSEIPDGLFSGSGLIAIDIPDEVTSIGASAFSGCQIGSLELPSELINIGASAFANNRALQSLVIPEKVVTIGESAFSGNTSLQMVDVRSTVLEKPGLNAFGSSQYNAYSRLDSDIVEGEAVLVGTTFYTPNETIEALFETGNNCYLGDISPMRIDPDNYQAPTCETQGYQGYIFTWNNIKQEYVQILSPLGHNYVYIESVEAACETDSYDLWRCTNADLGEDVCERPEERRNIGVVEKAKGHHYHVIAVDNFNISSTSGATLTWQCENENHDGNYAREIDMTIPGTTLTATTLQTLGEIESNLPDADSNLGTLLWADDVNKSEKLTFGLHSYHIKFSPAYSTAFDSLDSFSGQNLTIAVDVQKAILSFKDTTFQNWQRWIGQGTDALTISPLPEGVTFEKFQYRESGSQDEDAWSDTAPNEEDGTSPGVYEVRAVLKYDASIYQISTDNAYIPNDTASVLHPGAEGTCYITHRYTVAMMSMDGADYAIKSPLVYNGSTQNTLGMTGIPASAQLEFIYTKDGGEQQNYIVESAPSGGNFDTLPLLEAGTYTVDIHITHPEYNRRDFENIRITIEKCPVDVPSINNTSDTYPFIYTPGTEHIGVLDPEESAAYTLRENKKINAGDYTAVATLKDPDNYRWNSSEFADSQTANISWRIARRGLVSPSLRTTSYTYDGSPKHPVSDPSSGDYNISYSEGIMIVGFRGEENVFTVTNAEQTNAGDYTSVAEINEEKRGNYYWQEYDSQETASWQQQLGTWRIGRVQIRLNRPIVTSPEYTGAAFDESNINSTNVIPEAYRDILHISGYQYYTSSTSETPMSQRPVNVDTYYLLPIYEFLDGELAANYQLLGDGIQKTAFRINQKTVQLSATENQVAYDGSEKYIIDPVPEGMVSPEDLYRLVYRSYIYTPSGGTPGDPQIPGDTTKSPSFITAGTYQVTVGLDSTNYTAEDVVCTLIIDKASAQNIEFTSEDGGWNGDTDTIIKTYGDADFVVSGKGALDSNARVEYSIDASYAGYARVDSGNGTVTILGANETGFPVNAATEETANVAAASGSYTLIINKADTTIELGAQSVSYDGQPVSEADYAKAMVTQSQGIEDPDETQVQYKFYTTQEEAESGTGEGIGAPTNVGSYWLRADYPGSANYNASSAVAQFHITAADLIVTKQDAVTRTYDGQVYTLSDAITSVTNMTGEAVDDYTVTFIKGQAGDGKPEELPEERWNTPIAGAKNVSDSGSYFYKIEAANYATVYGKIEITVNPAPLILTSSVIAEKTYDGNQGATVSDVILPENSGAVVGEITEITAMAEYDTKDSGTGKTITTTYTLTFAVDAISENYSFDGIALTGNTVQTTQQDGAIHPIALTVSIPQQTKVYDGTADFVLNGAPAIANAEAIVPNETVNAALISNAFASTGSNVNANEDEMAYSFEAVSTDVIVLSGGYEQNYQVTAVTCPDGAMITKRPITLGFEENIDKNYDALPYAMTADKLTVGDGDLISPDTLQGLIDSGMLTFSYKVQGTGDDTYSEAPTEINNYTVRAVLEHNNYSAAEVSKDFSILSAALQVERATGYSAAYDAFEHPAAFMTVKDFAGNDLKDHSDLKIVYLPKVEDESAPAADDQRWSEAQISAVKNVSDSGEYWYKISYPNHADYVGSEAVTVLISPKEIMVDRTLTETKVYDNTTNALVVLNSETVNGAAGTETIAVSNPIANYTDKNVGQNKHMDVTYTLTTTNADLANYSFNGVRISETTMQTAEIIESVTNGTITQRPVYVTGIEAEDRVYDGTDLVKLTGTPLGNSTGGADGLVDGDEVGLVLAGGAGEMSDANAGTGKAVMIGTDDVHLTGSSAGNYTIAEVASATVNIAQATPTLTFSNNGNLTYEFDNAAVSEEIYRAAAEGVSGGETPSGTITYMFYIDPARTEPYINGETGNIPINVGIYYFTATLAADTNYLSVTANATLQILTAGEGRLEVTATAYVGTYDGASHPAAAFTVTGDGNSLTNGAANGYTVAFSETEGGPYTVTEMPIVKNVLDSKTWYYQVTTTNYGVRTGSFTVEILPKDLTVSHDSITRTYNGTTDAVVNNPVFDTGVGSGEEQRENIRVASVSASYHNPNVTTPEAQNNVSVTYTLVPDKNTILGNYTFGGQAANEYGQVTLTETGSITPAPVAVQLLPQASVYDGNAKAAGSAETIDWVTNDPVYSQDGQKDRLGISLSIPENSIHAGSYKIDGTASNPNYTVTFNDGTDLYTIGTRPITVQISDGSGVYGDEPDLSGIQLTDVTNTPENVDDGLVSGENIADFGIMLETNGTAGQPITNADSSYRIYAVRDGAEITVPTVYGDYMVTFINGAYTIVQRPIAITINNHSSAYLAEIDGGIANPVIGTDYTVSYTDDTSKRALYEGDTLTVTLSTTAKNTPGDPNSNAGSYPISAKAAMTRTDSAADMLTNYAIAYVGQTAYQGDETQGTYTICKAQLGIAFQNSDKASNGLSIAMTDNYTNPLILTNLDTGMAVEVTEDIAGIAEKIFYTSDNEAVVSSSGIIVQADASALFSINGTGSTTIAVSVEETNNYGPAETWFVLNVGEGGAINIQFETLRLEYNGQPQALVKIASINPSDARVEYRLGAEDEWSDEIPLATNAGTYTVYYRVTKTGYAAAEGDRTVIISKAENPARFVADQKSIAYTPGLVFNGDDPMNGNSLTGIPEDYQSSSHIQYTSANPAVAWAQDKTHQLDITGIGEAVITAVLPEDDNYLRKEVSYTLKVGTSAEDISYLAEDYSGVYDRAPHAIAVSVTSPTEYQVLYSTDGIVYSEERPQFIDAGTYTVYFKIIADGFDSVEGQSRTVTIEKKPITVDMFQSSVSNRYTYIGSPIEPPVTVTHNGWTLTESEGAADFSGDYYVEYGANTDTAEGMQDGSVTVRAVEGDGKNYTGAATVYFDIEPIGAQYMTAVLDRYYGTYDDPNTNHATVSVTFGQEKLVNGTDYELSCKEAGQSGHENCVIEGDVVTFGSVGTHTIIVTGKGNYTNSQTELSFYLLSKTDVDGGLRLIADGANETKIYTYGDAVNGNIQVYKPDTEDEYLTENVDYTLSYQYYDNLGNVSEVTAYTPDVLNQGAGMYVVTAQAQGSYQGTGTFVFLIQKRDLTDAVVSVDDTSALIYNGTVQEPPVAAAFVEFPELLTTADYDITYQNNINAGEAQVILTAKQDSNNFTGSVSGVFIIAPKDISSGFIVEEIPDQIYTGSAVTPTVTVRDENGISLNEADYIVSYMDNIEIGTANITIEGQGNYTGTIADIPFSIVAVSNTFALSVGKTEWVYDGKANAESITVTYDGNPLTIVRDYILTISKDGGESIAYQTTEEAVQAMIEPGTYIVTAAGTNHYAGVHQDAVTVTVEKIQPSITIAATPKILSGRGTITLTVTAQNLPDGTVLSELAVAKDGETQEALALTAEEEGYTAKFTAPNETATYLFSIDTEENEHYLAAYAEAEAAVVRKTTSGGGGGSWGGGSSSGGNSTNTDNAVQEEEEHIILTHNGYLIGYADGTFRPEGNITRAEAATIFARLMANGGEIPQTFDSVFADVLPEDWFYDSVNYLQGYGIILGRDETHFDPNENITRAEFVTICTRFDAYNTVETVNEFTDVAASHWAYAYINYAVHAHWINGYADGSFRPDAFITRAEAVNVVNNVLDRNADEEFIDTHSDYANRFVDVSREHWAYYEIVEAAVQHRCYLDEAGEHWQTDESDQTEEDGKSESEES